MTDIVFFFSVSGLRALVLVLLKEIRFTKTLVHKEGALVKDVCPS